MRSDIFDEYCKIMAEQGFVKEAESETRQDVLTEEAKIKDKEYKDTIQALYGLKIKTNDSEKPVLEQAHPGKMIIAPSYDRVNGLVEDLQERHNIMVGIVNKMPNGAYTQHRYAEKALLDELIRLGFSLDNAGEEKLCKVADECALRLTNKMAVKVGAEQYKIKKQSWLFLTPFVLKGIALGIGAIAAYSAYKNQFGENISESIVPDTRKALQELQDVQVKVSGLDKKNVDNWIANLNYLLSVLPKAFAIVQRSNPIPPIRTTDDMTQAQEHIEINKKDVEELKRFNDYFQKLSNELVSWAGKVSKMTGSSSSEPTNEVWKTLEGVWEGIVGSDFSEARRALETLNRSLNKQITDFESLMTNGVEEAKAHAQAIEPKLITMREEEKAAAEAPPSDKGEDYANSDADYQKKLEEAESYTYGQQ